jgi:hypothetical protein
MGHPSTFNLSVLQKEKILECHNSGMSTDKISLLTGEKKYLIEGYLRALRIVISLEKAPYKLIIAEQKWDIHSEIINRNFTYKQLSDFTIGELKNIAGDSLIDVVKELYT